MTDILFWLIGVWFVIKVFFCVLQDENEGAEPILNKIVNCIDWKIKYCGGNLGKSFTNFGQKSKSKSWDIYWTFKGLLIVTIFWLLLLSGRGQEHRFNPPNSGDDNDSDNNDNDNVL